MTGKHSEDEKSGLSRRQILGIGATVAGAAAAAPLFTNAPSAGATGPTYPLHPDGTTLAQTLLHNPVPGPGGYRNVVAGPGENSMPRPDLLAGATYAPTTRTPLLALNQLTDMHLVDAQSPARVEYIDRLDDPGSPLAADIPFQGAYRPQEMLSAHVAESMVQALNALPVAPVSGRPVDFTISTGDNADNTQYNELRWQINILDGHQMIRPDSGSISKWEGVGGPGDYDTGYWHPNGTPLFGKVDKYRGTWGFPTVPGLLDRCRAQFMASGIRGPWYTVFGNHDGLVQGTVPSLGVIGAVATGAVKITGLATGQDTAAILAAFAAGDAAALATLLTVGPAKLVTADKNRRMLNHKQTIAEHLNTTGTPHGHGYTQANVDKNIAYYSFDPTPQVHCIVLDTCDTLGDDTGSIDKTQFAWLTNELKSHSHSYLDTTGRVVGGSGTNKLVVIFSHHTVDTMTNSIGVNRVLGPAVASLLLQFPNVVAWVNGHTHRNTVTPHARAATAAVGGGFWEINTAAHIDWPEQARVVEIVDNGDGTLSIFGTIVDHAALPSWPANPTTPLELAALSRELGMNDPQRDPETTVVDGKRGALSDRNVELLVRAPYAVV